MLLTHFAFILFVALGGLLVLRWPRMALVHLPCFFYGVAIELVGWVCPLTPLEQRLRILAGQEGFEGTFTEHYLGRLIYPTDWESLHVWLGVALIAFNMGVYAVLIRSRRTSVA